jgi:hypothetical protein
MSETESLVAAFCKTVIDSKIAADSFAFPDKTTKTVLFYAGPEPKIVDGVKLKRKDPAFSPKKNWELAAREAVRLKASRIDDTSLFAYLRSFAFIEDLGALVDKASFDEAKKMVWDYVSLKFSQTGNFVAASTLICGADKKSSFRAAELMGMLENPAIEIVNERPVKLFQDFRALGANEVFRLACMTKLIELRARAKASNDNDDKALYENQRDFFLAWREGEKAAFKTLPKAERLAFRKERGGILSRNQAKTAP